MRANWSGLYRRRDGEERLWLSPEDIETTMEEALHAVGVFPTEQLPVVDIERFVDRLGVRMDQFATLDAHVLGQTEFPADGPPRILINRDLSGAVDDDATIPGTRGRWRATIAHEGSHVVLHRILFEASKDQHKLFQFEERAENQTLMRCFKKNVLYRGGGSDWREVQANMGMAALLMPKSLFKRLAARITEQHGTAEEDLCSGTAVATTLTTEMAALFDVSKQAAGIRLQTLRILSPAGQPRLTYSDP